MYDYLVFSYTISPFLTWLCHSANQSGGLTETPEQERVCTGDLGRKMLSNSSKLLAICSGDNIRSGCICWGLDVTNCLASFWSYSHWGIRERWIQWPYSVSVIVVSPL